MAWTELRSSAVIGTARRAQIPDAVDGHAITPEALPSPEERALAAAALLGTQRRAGITALLPAEPAPDPSPVDGAHEAPAAAVQLLDLALAGNLGRPAESNALVAHWLRTATARRTVVPHRLLVPLLTRATGHPDLQDPARVPLGERGRWLADQRADWAWATRPPADGSERLAILEPRFATSSGAERRAVLTAIRAAHPARGRELLEATWSHERAAERAGLLGCLVTGLSRDDDPFLDAALDDKSKTVREAAAATLDRLPTSARADRLRAVLTPLIGIAGLVRKRLTLAPVPDGTDLSRDLPGSTPTTARSELVRSAPLATWSLATRVPLDRLLTMDRDPANLLPWWSSAVVAQQDAEWAELLGIVTTSAHLLQILPGDWSLELSQAFVTRLRGSKAPSLAVNATGEVLIERLHPGAVAELEAWRRSLGDDDRAADTRLRQIIQLVSTRSSITEAFS